MLELVGIPAAARKRAGGYSMGMRQRLGLAGALLGDPQVLILDEPANGLDPEGIRWLRGFLRHLADEGKTLLISSHMLAEVEQTVDDVVIIANGRRVAQGTDGRAARRADGLRPHVRPGPALARPCAPRGLTVTPERAAACASRPRTSPRRRRRPRAATSPIHELRTEQTRPRGRSSSSSPRARSTATATSRCRWRPAERDAVADQEGASVMTAAITSEFRKFFTTRLWWGMAIAIFVAGAGVRRALRVRLHQRRRHGGPGAAAAGTDDRDSPTAVFTGGLRSATC